MTDVERPVRVQETLEASPNGRTVKNKLSMVVFSGDMDKVTAALIMATGGAAGAPLSAMSRSRRATSAVVRRCVEYGSR